MGKSETKGVAAEVKPNGMQHLKIYNKQDILSLTKIRRFETKVGERLQVVPDAGDLAKSSASSGAE